MLRLLARGPRTATGEPLNVKVTLRVLDYIDAHPEVGDRLSGLDEQGIRREFLALYAVEASRKSN